MQKKIKGMLKHLKLAGLALCLANAAYAQDSKPTVRAIKVQDPPTIDGKLEEWRHSSEIPGFYSLSTQEPARLESKVWLSYDNKNLYIAAHNAREDQDNDSFDVYLDSSPARYRLSINHTGINSLSTLGKGLEPKLSNQVKSSSQIKEDSWDIEIELPLTLLDGQQQPRILFARNADHEINVWPAATSINLDNAATISGIKPPAENKSSTKVGANVKENPTTREYGLGIKKELKSTSTDPEVILDVNYSFAEEIPPDEPHFSMYGRKIFPSLFPIYQPTLGEAYLETKALGRVGNTNFGIANGWRIGKRNDITANLAHTLAKALNINSAVSQRTEGDLQNTVTQAGVNFIKSTRGGKIVSSGTVTHTTIDSEEGSQVEASLRYLPEKAQPSAYLTYRSISEDYSPLTFVPETNVEGFASGIGYKQKSKRGMLEAIVLSADAETLNQQNGTFLRTNVATGTSLVLRGFPDMTLRHTTGTKEDQDDNLWDYSLTWSLNRESNKGSARVADGEVSGQQYRYFALSQETRPFFEELGIQGTLEYNLLGDEYQQQYAGTATYNPSNNQAIIGRIVSNTDWINGHISYYRFINHGLNLSLTLGDPQATEFKSSAYVKATINF